MLRSKLHLSVASGEDEFRSERKWRTLNRPGHSHLHVVRVAIRARGRQRHRDRRRVRSADDPDARHREHAAADGPGFDLARGMGSGIWSATSDMDAVGHLVIAARVAWIELRPDRKSI